MANNLKMLNCSLNAVENLYIDKSWNKIFKERGGVRIPCASPLDEDSFVQDQPSSIWDIMYRDGIQIVENDGFLSMIQTEPKSALNRPKDIYIIDSQTRESCTGANTGTILLPDESTPIDSLDASWQVQLKSGEKYSWYRFFTDNGRDIKETPSNALVVIDRYLLADYESGLQNLYDILEEVLPQDFISDYHVLLVIDSDQIDVDRKTQQSRHNVAGIAPAVHEAFCEMRPYPITTEILGIRRLGRPAASTVEKSLSDLFSDSHNRRIFSNSFLIRAEHGFDAIKDSPYDENIFLARFTQTIWFDALYSGVSNRYQDSASLPVKACDDEIKVLRKVMSPDSQCEYFINGEKGDPQKIKNRLLR